MPSQDTSSSLMQYYATALYVTVIIHALWQCCFLKKAHTTIWLT